MNDVEIVGGKNASLGEMYCQLVPKGIRVPNAFVVTAHAYRTFVAQTKLGELIKEELTDLTLRQFIKRWAPRSKRTRNGFFKKVSLKSPTPNPF